MIQIQNKKCLTGLTSLFPTEKKCKNCLRFLTKKLESTEDQLFYCDDCHITTSWRNNTTLKSMCISVNSLWLLLNLFIQKKTTNEAYNDMKNLLGNPISEKSVKKYFKLFSKIAYQFYMESHNNMILEGEVEIDETQLYKMKRSHAPGRPYTFHNIWLIGFRERGLKRFLIFPTESRREEIFIPLLQKHVKLYSTIYTDCFSVYVNNSRFLPESKLKNYGYMHKFVNHKIMFVINLFPEG